MKSFKYYDLVMSSFVAVLLLSNIASSAKIIDWNTSVFILIACALGVFPWGIALSLIVANYIFKVGIEVLLTPVTYRVVGFLKRVEEEDFFDRGADFNPFHTESN